jgi:hypothetical protein
MEPDSKHIMNPAKLMIERLKTGLKLWFMIAGTIGFCLFIIEEASQMATFSTFLSKNNSDLTLMLEASEIMDINNDLIYGINKWIGWINPFTYVAYNKYADAQDLYSNVVKQHILSASPELLEGRYLEFEFTPRSIENGVMINGRIKVISDTPSLSTTLVKGVVQNGKIHVDHRNDSDPVSGVSLR